MGKEESGLRKILIVEDDKVLNKTLAYNLTADGYEVTSAYSFQDAVERLKKSEFDIALLDINLPDGNGLHLCDEIRGRGQHTYIMFITANDKEGDMLKGYEAGCTDYITKPFSVMVLCKKVAAVFANMELRTPKHGKYRIPCTLIGLEEDTYNAYLKNMGISAHESGSAVIVNSVVKNPEARGYEAKKEQVSYLDVKEGQKLQLTEKFLDSVQGNYSFDLQISSVLTEMPDIGLNVAFYTLPIIVPMDEYYEIINNFGKDRAVYNYRTYMNLRTEQGRDLAVQNQADQLCGQYLSKNDFFTSSKTQRAVDRDKLTNATMLIVYSLTALFGIVGITSAVAAILNSLYQRKKEFAMLRSVGLDKKELCHLLYTEGFLLVSKPLLIGILILILVSSCIDFHHVDFL